MVKFDRAEEVERLNTKPNETQKKSEDVPTGRKNRNPQNNVIWKTYETAM